MKVLVRLFMVVAILALPVAVFAQSSGEMPEMNLRDILVWLAGGVGAGLVAWWLIGRLPLDDWTAEWKRLLAFIVAAVLAGAAWGLELWLGFAPIPSGVEAWADAIIAILVASWASTAVSQMAHAFQKARAERA